jgi:hypothetical protein
MNIYLKLQSRNLRLWNGGSIYCCGCVTTMTVNVPHPLLTANEFVPTPFVDSLPRTVAVHYLRSYTQVSVSFISYRSCVECSTLC